MDVLLDLGEHYGSKGFTFYRTRRFGFWQIGGSYREAGYWDMGVRELRDSRIRDRAIGGQGFRVISRSHV